MLSLLDAESSDLSESIEGGAYLMSGAYLKKYGKFIWLWFTRLWFKINHITRGFKMPLSEVVVILFVTFDKKPRKLSLLWNIVLC